MTDGTAPPISSGAHRQRVTGHTRPAASLIVAAVVALILVLGGSAVFAFPAHHDLAWILYMAAQWIDGAALYRDVVEVNPPLIVFFSLPAAFLARVTGTWDIAVYRMMVLVLAAGSLVFSAHIAQKLYADRPIARGTLLTAAAFAFALLDTMQFGQREHITLVLLLPYVLLAACRVSGAPVRRRTGSAAGVMAGIALAFKPHFVIPWLAVEAYLHFARLRGPGAAGRTRIAVWRPETAGIFVAALGYLAAVVLFTPEFFRFAAYTVQTYGGYGAMNRWLLITRLPTVRIIAALSAAAILMPPVTGSGTRVRHTLAVAALGFLIAAVAQGKGWSYHWVPAYGFAVIAAAAGLADAARMTWLFAEARVPRLGVHASRFTVAAVATPALLLAAMLPWVARQHRIAGGDWARVTHASNRLPELLAVVEELGHGGPIAALSLNMQTAFPLVNYAAVSWALRFPALWPLQSLYPPVAPGAAGYAFRTPDRMPAAEKFLFDSVVEDLAASQPTLIIVDRQPRYGLHGFDFLAYFAQDAGFRQLLQEYEPAAVIERYLVLRSTSTSAALKHRTRGPKPRKSPTASAIQATSAVKSCVRSRTNTIRRECSA